MRSTITFTATIWKWPAASLRSADARSRSQAGPTSAKTTAGAWHFVHVPREYFEPVRTKYGKGMIKVSATIGKTQWDTSLFPLTKDRSLLVCIKAKVRKTEGLMAGDEVKLKVKIG